MKKYLTFVLVFTVSFSLFACTSSNEVKDGISQNNKENTSTQENEIILYDEVNAYVQKKNENIASIILAEAAYEDKRIAIVWPAIRKDFSSSEGENVDCNKQESCPYADDDIIVVAFMKNEE